VGGRAASEPYYSQLVYSVCISLSTFFMLLVWSVFWLFLLGCQYQCQWLSGKTCLQNDL